MSKRRSSIRGKGAEILFGAPPAVNIKPRSADPTLALVRPAAPKPTAGAPTSEAGEPSSPPSPRPQPTFNEKELERALQEEARAGAPDSSLALEKDLIGSGEELSPTLEVEATLVEQSPGAAEEEARGKQDLMGSQAFLEPPLPETVDVASDVLPPRPTRMAFDLNETEPATADIQTPGETVEQVQLPERGLTREEEDELVTRYGQERLQKLAGEIDDLYEQVRAEVGVNKEISTWCFNRLLQAKDIVLRYDVARISQAEYEVEQVRARLRRAADSQAAARKHAWWITGWGFLWGVLFLSALVMLGLGWFEYLYGPATVRQAYVDPAVFLQAMVWGGVGGVVAIWYSLFKHVSQRDFDIQYSLSYVTKPFFGLILGGTVYMVVQLLILSLGISPVELPEGIPGLATPTIAPWIIYLMAWLCGFNENRIFGLVDGMVRRTFSSEGITSAA
jgi:hypothetical protein